MTALPSPSPGRSPAPRPGQPPRNRRAPAQGDRQTTARRLRAVPPAPARQGARTWMYGVLSIVILVTGVIGTVALNALAAEASFQARELESEISNLTLQHDDLVAAIAVLEAPGRVQDVASTQLGLIQPEQPGFLTLSDSDLSPDQPKEPLRLDSARLSALGN